MNSINSKKNSEDLKRENLVRQTWVFVRFASAHATACIHWAEDKDRFDIQGSQGKKTRWFFCHWLQGEIGGGKLDKTLAEADCVGQDSGPKKNAPAEGRFLGRPMGAKPRPVI